MPGALDMAAIRSRFSALDRRVNGQPAVYLDGPGGSQTPDSVARAVADYLVSANANLGGSFVTSVATEELVDDAHLAAADLLGCSAEEVVFGANTTTINFLLAHAVARTLEAGDEIIVTELDHDANVSPWLLVAADRGLTVRTAPLDSREGTLEVDAVVSLIGERTRVVAFTLASNALGSIPDAARPVRGRARGRRPGVGRRRPSRSAPPRRPRGDRCRCASDLRLQVFRATSGGRGRPRRAGARRCPPTASAPRSKPRRAIGSRPARCATRRSPDSSPRSSTSSRWEARPMTAPPGLSWRTRGSPPTSAS